MPQPDTDETFVDLEIRIFQPHETGYPVEITLGAQQEFPRGVLPLELASWQSSGDRVADGQQLFTTLLADPALNQAWHAARGQAPRRRIRLRIDPTAPELHGLPWELLQEEQVMLAAGGDTPFSRYLPVALPWGSLAEERPIRILAVIANPQDLAEKHNLAPLAVETERDILEKGVSAADAGSITLKVLEPPITLERLEEALREGYHVLHYVGHGVYSQRRGQAGLYLQDDAGNTQVVTDDALVGVLSRLPSGARPLLVFLAACQSAVRDTADAFRGLGPKLVSVGTPAVVAMQDFVSIETAHKLNGKFYQNLAAHGCVDRALNEARSSLLTSGRPDAAVPVLFLRLKSGQLWDPAANARGEILGARNPKIFWTGQVSLIEKGRCIPIIGPRAHGQWLPTSAEIARRWAVQHGYPFCEDADVLARVAQYLASSQGEDFPRYELLGTLITEFTRRLPEELRPKKTPDSLSDLVAAIGWPTLSAADPNDAHTVLAGLNLPLYLTTNPDNFMVEALRARGRAAVHEMCRWNENLDDLPSLFEDNASYEPTVEAPLVYHLFGRNEEVQSLVITEDNYLDYLVRVSAEMERIPNFIRGALANASLMFVGYSLYDWEFRVIMRGLIATMDQRHRFKHVAVQLEMDQNGRQNVADVQTFLQQYFQNADINVFWGSPAQFIAELREHWEARG